MRKKLKRKWSFTFTQWLNLQNTPLFPIFAFLISKTIVRLCDIVAVISNGCFFRLSRLAACITTTTARLTDIHNQNRLAMMFDILIIRFFMFLQKLSLCCFMITSIAGITFTFMNNYLHIFQSTEFCCFTRSTITSMFLTCMKIFCKTPQRTQLGHPEMTTVASLINSISNFMLFQKVFSSKVSSIIINAMKKLLTLPFQSF